MADAPSEREADACEHGVYTDVAAEEFARLAEGTCTTCDAPGTRDGEWSVCPCCGVGWRLDRSHIYVRMAVPAAALSASPEQAVQP